MHGPLPPCRATFLLLFLGGLFGFGCAGPDPDPPPAPVTKAALVKKVPLGNKITLEVKGDRRRVVFPALICRRDGPLEMLLTRKNKKTHEAILEADVDARKLHEALLLAGAKPGNPVSWLPEYKAPTGTLIRVTLEYEDKGKKVSVPGGSWIRNSQNMQPLDSDWVFAGSQLVDDPFEKGKKVYTANEGDLICVSNFESAMLDLPFKSSKDDAERSYEAYTERIPAVDTPVTVILEPVKEERAP